MKTSLLTEIIRQLTSIKSLSNSQLSLPESVLVVGNLEQHLAAIDLCVTQISTILVQHKLYCPAHKEYAKDEIIDNFSEPMKIIRVVDDKVQVDHTVCYQSGTSIVHSLGTIEHTRDGFHSKQYITPVASSFRKQ